MIDASKKFGQNYVPGSGLNVGANNVSTSQATRPSAEGTSAASTVGPSTIVDLSDRAKALLAQTRVAQDVADDLAKQVSVMKGKDPGQTSYQKTTNNTTKPNDDLDIFKVISGTGATKPTEQTKSSEQINWKAGAPYGDATKSDAEFLKTNYYEHMDLVSAGWSAEEELAFKDAIRSGTVKMQKTADVEGSNLETWQVFTPSANGAGGYDSMGGTSQNPTGDVKKAIDSHRALAMWTADRGGVYFSW